MLESIAILFIIVWLLGMVSGITLGNAIWLLLVVAIVLFLVRLIEGNEWFGPFRGSRKYLWFIVPVALAWLVLMPWIVVAVHRVSVWYYNYFTWAFSFR
jgi:hypothetical protein